MTINYNMVKSIPCEQYKGPQIKYQRNGQTFCRSKISNKSERRPKVLPCKQYTGDHLVYIRNGRSFCRRKTSLKKKHNQLTPIERTIGLMDRCQLLNKKK